MGALDLGLVLQVSNRSDGRPRGATGAASRRHPRGARTDHRRRRHPRRRALDTGRSATEHVLPRGDFPSTSSRTLGICVAHPDDETCSTFGSVAIHADDPQFGLVVVHATDGDAGETAPGVAVGPGGLGALRRDEDERAWRAVGRTPDRHDWLGIPDGHVSGVPLDELTASVVQLLDQERPEVVLTFGPDGITGHPDHIAMGAATDAAFHRVRRDGGAGLSRLLHGAIPRWFDRHQTWRSANGSTPWDPTLLYQLRSVPDHLIGVDVRTSAVGAPSSSGGYESTAAKRTA